MRLRKGMPVYTIRFPGKMWATLLDREDVFSRIPPASRIAYATATVGGRSMRFVDGTTVELLPILRRLQDIVRSIRNGPATAKQYGVSLRQLDRYAHQMLVVLKENP